VRSAIKSALSLQFTLVGDLPRIVISSSRFLPTVKMERGDCPIPATYAGPNQEARMIALQTVAQELNATLNQVVLA
jgi:hypothetical protein